MNSNERNELYKQYEDCLFRVLMYRYAENEGERFIVENEALKRENKYQPSPKAVGRFNKSVNKAVIKSKLHSFMISIRPLINKAAVFIVILGLVFSFTFTFVSAFRIEVLNFLLKFQEKYTLIRLDDNENNTDSDNSYIIWRNVYIPTYIPEGYYIYSFTNEANIKVIDFVDEHGNIITFCELSASIENTLDTENASLVKNININGNAGLLVVKEDRVSIAWSDNVKIFTLHTQLPIEETVKIAESVSFID